MKKSFLYMMRKTMVLASLILPLIAGLTLMSASAQLQPKICVDPQYYKAPFAPGHDFVININLTDISASEPILGYEFQLWYNSSLIKATLCTPWNKTNVPPGINPVGTSFGPLAPNLTWIPINNTVKPSLGRVWVMAAFPITKPQSGSAIAMRINFTTLAEGDTTLDLNSTVLGNTTGQAVEHVALDGQVVVVPEFPASIVTPLLLIATLVATFMGKMVWPRKRKDADVAE